MTEYDETHSRDRRGWADWDETVSTVERVPLSERVVGAMSDALGADPVEIDPLGEVVDADALDALFGPRFDGTNRSGGSITLKYCGRRVTARPDGTVVIDKPPED